MTAPLPTETELERLRARVAELEHERRQLITLAELLQELTGALHVTDIAQAVARRLGTAFGLDRCSVFLSERDDRTARLVASFEDPAIRNYMVDLGRYPELRRALQTGETVLITDATSDPALLPVREALLQRNVASIAAVPMSWRGAVIGAIFLRTFREAPPITESELQFARAVASVATRALRAAHRFERLAERRGETPGDRARDAERAALLALLRRLLDAQAGREGAALEALLPETSVAELDRLVDVALTVIQQQAAGR